MKKSRMIPIKIKSSILRILLTFRGDKNYSFFIYFNPRRVILISKRLGRLSRKGQFAGDKPFAAFEQPDNPISVMIHEDFPISERHSGD